MPEAPLAGAVALVTGASRGIGAAVAIELARLGAHCVLTARTQGGLEATDDAIRTLGGAATLLPLDLLRDGEKLDMLGPSIAQRFGRLDIVVHAAGVLAGSRAVLIPSRWLKASSLIMAAAVTCQWPRQSRDE
jgi:NAD(P)-dependent dehydrogenase (short-subunit alcohol dehydrogenase family)